LTYDLAFELDLDGVKMPNIELEDHSFESHCSDRHTDPTECSTWITNTVSKDPVYAPVND